MPVRAPLAELANRLEQAFVVVPVDPFQRRVFDLVDVFPRPAWPLGFNLADDALGQGIVVGVADAADRGFDVGFSEPLGVTDRQILGGFKRSLQHFHDGGCDDDSKTAVRFIGTGQIELTRAAASCSS
jgi:hypothetical protein